MVVGVAVMFLSPSTSPLPFASQYSLILLSQVSALSALIAGHGVAGTSTTVGVGDAVAPPDEGYARSVRVSGGAEGRVLSPPLATIQLRH